jgi:hypothetical protein
MVKIRELGIRRKEKRREMRCDPEFDLPSKGNAR